ncbi:uncharacterized protein LOC120353517 isoform X3 [Nilaparvata lugens]|uniref:uncharacterized protein LOC120353517 isoform X1 n=1 Tax=Nilaparvata lugens TaxID=108931 RepID=UPI00193EA23E|nr:uncharacterized protein LOC120353517 isoform X1 [Nilaparvata lugens]XP_039293333.1 uncharacterized protein LOC120353517 isoform X2 [Nilaparvata lugens]XP_039293334.1 uncharacterized protein LOC120353517 isoform X3 [Nilaparvata lugens]
MGRKTPVSTGRTTCRIGGTPTARPGDGNARGRHRTTDCMTDYRRKEACTARPGGGKSSGRKRSTARDDGGRMPVSNARGGFRTETRMEDRRSTACIRGTSALKQKISDVTGKMDIINGMKLELLEGLIGIHTGIKTELKGKLRLKHAWMIIIKWTIYGG